MTATKSAWRSPWVIGWISIVVVVLTVNFVMIYLAVEANPGLVVEDYYDRGQDYEKNMVARMQKNPGWAMEILSPGQVSIGKPAVYGFTVADREGLPIDPDRVLFHAYRPSDAKADFSLAMVREGAGRYRAEVVYPLKGVWDVLVSVHRGEEEYNEAVRVTVAEQ